MIDIETSQLGVQLPCPVNPKQEKQLGGPLVSSCSTRVVDLAHVGREHVRERTPSLERDPSGVKQRLEQHIQAVSRST